LKDTIGDTANWLPPSSVDAVESVLTTTRAVRKRLDLDRPVPRDLIERCLRIAFQAPTGVNAQNWSWVVVGDTAIKHDVAELYRQGLKETESTWGKQFSASGFRLYGGRRGALGSEGGSFLAENLERVPFLLVPSAKAGHSHGLQETFFQATHWGSILQAVWSFMLALRTHGLGSSWTTVHLLREREMGKLLGIPPDYVQAGLFPIAYTRGTTFRPANRTFSETTVHWDHWNSR
jgi:nitroreductase